MATATAQKNYFTYVGGLMTESSPLTTPDNASSDEDNMDLKRNGTRIRRRGVDFEKGGSAAAFTQTHAANYYDTGAHVITRHEWRSIGGDGQNNKLLLQMGASLYMIGLDVAVCSTGGAGITFNNTAIGGGATDAFIDLSNAAVGAADVGLDAVDISFGKGAAYVVGPNMSPIVIQYDTATAAYTTTFVGGAADNILIRDFNGVDDGLSVDTRPVYATWAALVAGNPNHAYNLLNQGWTGTHVNTYAAATGVAPSNSDIWWYGKNATGIFTPTEMDKLWFGSMTAAQGHYLHNAFTHTRSAIVAGATNYTTTARPSCTAFYSGRVWYAGIKDGLFSGTIMYSRIIEDPLNDAHHCHMDADPTSEIISELIAADGGTITIPEAGEIVRLIPAASGLLVFAKNGVWHVKGTQDSGFSATGFAVLKVTNVGCDAPQSIVEVEGSVMYWSRSGVYLVSMDQNSFNMAAQNITQDSIQTKIEAVDNTALPYVYGDYDPLEREVKFCYAETADAYGMFKNKTLTLDLVLKAWYTGTISGTNVNPFIVAPFKTLNTASVAPNYESMLRYIVIKPTATTTTEVYVAAQYDDKLVDWYTDDTVGLEFSSFIETTNELMEDAMRSKRIDEVHLYFQRTESTVTNGVLDQPSSCMMQYKFDWADDDSSGLWTKKEQAYKFLRPLTIPSGVGTFPFVYGQEVIVTKHNVRGAGRALKLRLESVGTNDMHALGWAIRISGVTR